VKAQEKSDMDREVKEQFLSKWEKYFGQVNLPIVFLLYR